MSNKYYISIIFDFLGPRESIFQLCAISDNFKVAFLEICHRNNTISEKY